MQSQKFSVKYFLSGFLLIQLREIHVEEVYLINFFPNRRAEVPRSRIQSLKTRELLFPPCSEYSSLRPREETSGSEKGFPRSHACVRGSGKYNSVILSLPFSPLLSLSDASLGASPAFYYLFFRVFSDNF